MAKTPRVFSIIPYHPKGGARPAGGFRRETRAVPTLELTTTIRRVSSSPKARSGLSPAAAAGRAVASIRYITRSTAAEAVEWSGARLDAAAPEGHKAVKAALADAIHERAQEGGKQGRVIAGRFIVSLPIGWPLEARQEALRQVCAHLAPPGSDALAMGALHNDKPDNPHMHILAVDGLEAPNWPAPRRRPQGETGGHAPGSPPKAVLARRRDACASTTSNGPRSCAGTSPPSSTPSPSGRAWTAWNGGPLLTGASPARPRRTTAQRSAHGSAGRQRNARPSTTPHHGPGLSSSAPCPACRTASTCARSQALFGLCPRRAAPIPRRLPRRPRQRGQDQPHQGSRRPCGRRAGRQGRPISPKNPARDEGRAMDHHPNQAGRRPREIAPAISFSNEINNLSY